jgi:hypothetical protein
LQLPVRMGLATGEAELRDGDYFGTVLNRAARVMAAGHGGQILLAESTAGLVSGVGLVDLGPRRLVTPGALPTLEQWADSITAVLDDLGSSEARVGRSGAGLVEEDEPPEGCHRLDPVLDRR